MKIKTLIMVILCSVILSACCEKKNLVAIEYSGEPVGNNAQIFRDKNTKTASLQTSDIGDWKIYAGRSVDSINTSTPFAEGSGAGELKLNIPTDARSYFLIVTPKSKAILSEKHLPMEGGYNFRDLGGIRNSEGKYVKWGKIFRSDDLNHLTIDDLNYLSTIPLNSIIDFRSETEIDSAPDKNPSSVRYPIKLSINPGNLMSMVSDSTQSQPSAEQMASLMEEMNRLFVTDPEIIATYRKFFEYVQDEKYMPLMYHCSAGKDRTGMATALILAALGVDRQTILADYVSSNEYLKGKYADIVEEYPNLKPLMEVRPEYLEAGLDQIEQKYGNIENFLTNQLGVDIDKMRDSFLY